MIPSDPTLAGATQALVDACRAAEAAGDPLLHRRAEGAAMTVRRLRPVRVRQFRFPNGVVAQVADPPVAEPAPPRRRLIGRFL